MAPRPLEDMENVIPKMVTWLRLRSKSDRTPVVQARLVLAADTIERLTKERDEALKQFAVDAAQAQNQIDAAAAQRVQIKDLQGRLWSVRESRDHARKQRDAALADLDRSQQALHKAESDRESLLAEVERYQNSFAEGRARLVHRA